MKKQMMRLVGLMLALVLCLGLLPAVSAAEERPAISDAAEAVIACANGNVTVRTSKVTLPMSNGQFRLYATVNAAELPEERWGVQINFTAGGKMSSNSFRPGREENLCSFTLPSGLRGWQTVSITVKNTDGQVDGTGELELYFGTHEEYPLTEAEAAAKNEGNIVPAGATSASVLLYFPLTAGLEKETYVLMELLDSEGRCRGSSRGNSTQVYERYIDDLRYAPFFSSNALPSALCTTVNNTIICGSPLEPGSYSVRIVAEDGTAEKTFENVVEVTGDPVADLQDNGSFLTADGQEMHFAAVYIRSGDPADYQVQIVRGDRVLATSNGHRIMDDYSDDIRVRYYIPLPEGGLAADSTVSREYLMEILYAYGIEDWKSASDETKAVVMEETGLSAEEIEAALSGESADALEVVLVSKSGAEVIGDTRMEFDQSTSQGVLDEFATFDNHFYASVYIPSYGYSPDQKFVLKLEYRNEVLAETTVSPDKNGVFRAIFTDDEGNMIPLNSDGYGYAVRFYSQSGSNLSYVFLYNQNVNIRSNYAALMAEEQTLPLEISGIYPSFVDEYMLRCVVETADDSVMSVLQNAELHLTPVGSDSALVLKKAETSDEAQNWLDFESKEPLSDGYYTAKLYCDGKLVVDMNGTDLLADRTYELDGSIEGWIQTVRFNNNPLRPFAGAGLDGIGDEDVARLVFYALNNTSGVPDYSFTSRPGQTSFWLRENQIEELGSRMYTAELYVNDAFVAASGYNFWSCDGWGWDGTEYFSVSVDPAIAEQATVELIPSCHVDENGDYQAYSEIFVKVTPNRGRTLDEILVNGQPLGGNAFILNKDDTVISATFGELPVHEIASKAVTDTYEVTEIPDGAVITCLSETGEPLTSAAVGETVTVTVEPAADYMVRYVMFSSGSHLTENENGTWSFVMPDSDVMLYARLREKYDVTVTPVVVGKEGGSLTVEGAVVNDYGSCVLEKGENGPVTMVATPDEGYCLAELYYEAYDYNTYQTVRYDLIEEPVTGETRKTFTAPSTRFVVKAVFGKMETKAVGSYTDSKNNQVVPNVTEQMPGGEVILTVQPIANYKLKAGTLKVKSTEGAVELTKIDDNTYSFVMPWFDVTVEADFLCVAPGGVVTDAQTLLTALGGAGTLEDGTVTMQEDVVLLAPVDVQDGTMTLNVNGHTITGPDASTVVSVSGNADLTMFNGYVKPGENSGTDCYGILLKNGKLTLSGELTVYSGTTTEEDSSAAVKVEGGELFLTARKVSYSVRAPRLEGIGCGDGLRITGGTVTMEDGTALGGTYWGDMPEVASEPGLQGGGFEGNTSTPGGNGIWITGKGNLIFLEEAGCSGGANHAGLMIGTATEAAEGEIRITGGDLDGGTGGVGLWVRKKAADLQISGGVYWPGYNYDWMYSIILEESVMADYLQDGCLIQIPADKWMETPAMLLSDNRQTYEDKVEIIPCGLPVFADTELTEEAVTLTETEGTVTVKLAQLGQKVHVLAGFYDGNGKLVGLGMADVGRGTESVTLTAELSAAAQTVRLFLLDDVTDIPVTQCLNWSK